MESVKEVQFARQITIQQRETASQQRQTTSRQTNASSNDKVLFKSENIQEEFRLHEMITKSDNLVRNHKLHKFNGLIDNWCTFNSNKQQKLINQKLLLKNLQLQVYETEQMQEFILNSQMKMIELRKLQEEKQEKIFIQEHHEEIANNKLQNLERTILNIKDEIFTVTDLNDIAGKREDKIQEQSNFLQLQQLLAKRQQEKGVLILRNEEEYNKTKLMKQKEEREKNYKIIKKTTIQIQKIRTDINVHHQKLGKTTEKIEDLENECEQKNYKKTDTIKFLGELEIIQQIKNIFLDGDPSAIDLQKVKDINDRENDEEEYFIIDYSPRGEDLAKSQLLENTPTNNKAYYFLQSFATGKKLINQISNDHKRKVERINKFIQDFDNDVEGRIIQIIQKFRELQIQEITNKNRIDDTNGQLIMLKCELKNLDAENQKLIKNCENIEVQDNFKINPADIRTLLNLEDQDQQQKNKIDYIYINLEKFISRKFDFFNQLIDRHTSVIGSVFAISQIENPDFKKSCQKYLNMNEKIKRILKAEEDDLLNQNRVKEGLLNRLMELKEICQIRLVQKIDRYHVLSYIRQDFVLFNFLKNSDLDEFLLKSVKNYEMQDDSFKNYTPLKNFLIENTLELKEKALYGFQKTLQFLMLCNQELLMELIENIELSKTQLAQLTSNKEIQNKIPGIEKIILYQQNLYRLAGKKSFRSRITMAKCRAYQMYYGLEIKKAKKTKAETIVDVIYEAIYDVTKGIQNEYELNPDEEQKHFKFQRLKALIGDDETEQNSQNSKIQGQIPKTPREEYKEDSKYLFSINKQFPQTMSQTQYAQSMKLMEDVNQRYYISKGSNNNISKEVLETSINYEEQDDFQDGNIDFGLRLKKNVLNNNLFKKVNKKTVIARQNTVQPTSYRNNNNEYIKNVQNTEQKQTKQPILIASNKSPNILPDVHMQRTASKLDQRNIIQTPLKTQPTMASQPSQEKSRVSYLKPTPEMKQQIKQVIISKLRYDPSRYNYRIQSNIQLASSKFINKTSHNVRQLEQADQNSYQSILVPTFEQFKAIKMEDNNPSTYKYLNKTPNDIQYIYIRRDSEALRLSKSQMFGRNQQ